MLYQEKAGKEMANEMVSSLVEASVKGLSYLVDFDNEEELKVELNDDKQLKKVVGRQAVCISEKYGDVAAYLKLLYTIGKHISFKFMKNISPEVEVEVKQKDV